MENSSYTKKDLQEAESDGHRSGLNQALDWVLEVLNGTSNTWLEPVGKCEAIKKRIEDLKRR